MRSKEKKMHFQVRLFAQKSILVAFLCILPSMSFARYYRSYQTGDWNTNTTWQWSNNNLTWNGPTANRVPAAGDNVTIRANHTVTISSSNPTPNTLTVDGTIKVQGTSSLVKGAGIITFKAGSVYEHARDAGTIPIASWDVGSTCLISGVTANSPEPTTFNQAFGNFTWNCTQTNYVSIGPTTMSILGNLTVTKTGNAGAYDFAIEQDITIGKDLILNGGKLRGAYATNRNYTINGNVNISSGGQITVCTAINTAVVANIYIKGNVTASSADAFYSASNGASGNIIFNGTASQPQLYSAAGLVLGPTNFIVKSGALLQMASPTSYINGSGIFTLESGATLGIKSADGITTGTATTGHIQVTGTRTYTSGASYIYNGDIAQVTGNGLTQNTPANLTINTTNTTTLSAATTLSGNLTITKGTLNLGMGLVHTFSGMTFTAGSLLGGSSTMNINGVFNYTAGTFTAGTSTINYNQAAPQTVGNFTYYNLKLSGSGNKSITATMTVQNDLGISGSAKANISSGITVSAASFTYNITKNTTGTWGSTSSTATNKDNTWFTATNGLVSLSDSRIVPTFTVTNKYICQGATATLTGTISSGTTYPAIGEVVGVTINGVTQNGSVINSSGGFTVTFPSSSLAINTYTITYYYDGNASLKPIQHTASYLYIQVPPTVTSVDNNTCFGSPSVLSASGAANVADYRWYDAETGGNLIATGVNSLTYYDNVSLWVCINYPTNCESQRVNVYAKYPGYSVDSQIPGEDSWIGYVSGINDAGGGVFSLKASKYGHIYEPETFTEGFGATNQSCVKLYTQNPIGDRNFYTEKFGIHFLMNSTRKGLYTADLGSDDGGTLYLTEGANPAEDVYHHLGTHGITVHPNVLVNLSGKTKLTYDYYENVGGDDICFRNITLLLKNELSGNTAQLILPGTNGLTISGDEFGTLPAGFSSPGYQWVLANVDGTSQTVISGATNSTLAPGAATGITASGTYYLFRKASLTSANNYFTPGAGNFEKSYTTQNLSNYAKLVVAGPGITVLPTALYGFTYVVGEGPSSEQSFTVAGVDLTNDITITVPTEYEISELSSGVFKNSITLTKNTNNQVYTTVYVRLKAGLSAGTYNNKVITLSAGSATASVSCNGYTIISGITASGGGSYCGGETLNLNASASGYTSVYWCGPTNFYSNIINPSITSLACTNDGIYTVTSTYSSGSNLVINGDFESGNVNFTSCYAYTDSLGTIIPKDGYGALGPEGRYAIVANPKSVHSNFPTYADHTSNPGKYQLVVNGTVALVNLSIWTQEISVTKNTDYQVSYCLSNVTSSNPAKIQLVINGINSGPVLSITNPGDPNNGPTGQWFQFKYNWNSGNDTIAKLSLIDVSIAQGGNDFSLDDIEFRPVTTASSSVGVQVVCSAVNPSVIITALPGNTVNPNTSVTYTATPSNGGTAPTYQWFVNGNPVVGVTTKTYSYTPVNGDNIYCLMTSNSNCTVSTQTANSNTITMVVGIININNYWYGGINSDWGTAANWTANSVPGSGDNIVFATNAVNALVLDVDRTIGSLTNQSDKSLIIPIAKCLTVNNTIVTKNNNPDLIYIKADPTGSNQNGSLIFPNATDVYGTVEMYSKGHYTDPPFTDLTTGNKYYYSWQYFGIPIEPITAYPTFNGSYLRDYHENSPSQLAHWRDLVNGSTLNPFIGYEITQKVDKGKMIYFQGKLVNRAFTSEKLQSTSGALYPGQYVFANPYTAAIDVKKFLQRNSTADFDGVVYFYNTGNYADWSNNGIGISAEGILINTPGMYQVCTQLTGIGLPTQIPSMQAILIKLATGGLDNSKITFNYNDVVRNNQLQRVKQEEDRNNVYTKIDVVSSNYGDRMWIFSDKNFTHSFDKGFDGYKMLGMSFTPQLYALESDGNKYQIAAVDNMNNMTLGFERGLDNEYTFTFTHYNASEMYSRIYLQDSVDNKTIDITASGSQYTFKVDKAGKYTNRFKLIAFKSGSSTDSSKLNMFYTGTKCYVHNLSNESGDFTLYDISGRLLVKSKFQPNSLSEVCNIPKQGIYIGKAEISSERSIKPLVLK